MCSLLDPLAVHLVHDLDRLAVARHEDEAAAAAHTVQLRKEDGVLDLTERGEQRLELDSRLSAG